MKKILSIITTVSLLLTAAATLNAGAEEKKTVRVTVQNERFAVSDGAPWEGKLLDVEVALGEDDSIESVIERAVSENGFAFTVSEYGYISSVNGLSEYAANGSGGWMAALNNWFTSDGTSAYTVKNGGLQAGDEIVMQYTCSWGADVGSLYGDFTTTLSADEFGISGAHVADCTYRQLFSPAATDYTIYITSDADVLDFNAVPVNKNYQVRAYKNNYQPAVEGADFRGCKNIPVENGDTVYIGVGNPAWPSMNSWAGTAEETVYRFAVKKLIAGDLNDNGMLDVDDVTVLQRHLAEFTNADGSEIVNDENFMTADFDGNGVVDIADATKMQTVLAEFDV